MKNEITIVGAGIIGMSLALVFSSKNKKVTILERNLKKSLSTNRIYSISTKSKRLFEEINVWGNLKELNKINKMHLYYRKFSKEKSLCLHSDKREIGYISQSNDLMKALLKEVKSDGNIELIDNSNITNVYDDEDKIFNLEVDNSKLIKTHYIFSCEGANSLIKKQLDSEFIKKNYNAKAYVFNLSHEISNKNIAHQIFLESGPVAFLPIGEKEFSMVVSVNNNKIDKSIFEKDNIVNFINKITNKKFGKIKLTSDLISFDLYGFNLESYRYGNIIFVGDSAHSIHPLAGMGLNLGISDIIEISKSFEKTISSFGNLKFFDNYARKQKIVNSHARGQLEAIEKLYALDNSFIEKLINFGMSSIDNSELLKDNIIRYANQNLSIFR